jgi:lactoylglutathione lyase
MTRKTVMKIGHMAIWARDAERLRLFYEDYFMAKANKKYCNPTKHFSSYFLSFDSDVRLEIMQMDSVKESSFDPAGNYFGLAHFAISVGSKEKVIQLTERLKKDGYPVLDGPRETGDGCFESAVLDPEGNRLEITV